MATVKKIPQRLCLGCQTQHPKKELVRVVRSPEGEFSVDFTGKKSGRGAYICHSEECFLAAIKAKRFNKAFQTELSAEVVETLRNALQEQR